MKRHSILFSILIVAFSANTQQIIPADIHMIISSAQSESPEALLAETRLNNERWKYIGGTAAYKPQLALNATLPNINRQISAISLPDGTEAFVNRSFMTNNVGVSLSQVLSSTGSELYVRTDLERLDLFGTATQTANTSYLSTPISVGFVQPIFQFNPHKWNKKITLLEYESSKKAYVEDQENIAYDAVNYFFQLYIANLNLESAEKNKEYLDSISNNAEGRYSVGRISKTELLQIQLQSKNAKSNIAQLSVDIQNYNEDLRNFLALKDQVEFKLSEPENLNDYLIDKTLALAEANRRRSDTEQFRLRMMLAERDVEQADKNSGPILSVRGSFGLTQTGSKLVDVYGSLLDQENISVGVTVPIADWGRTKAQREIARSNLELAKIQNSQDQIKLERDILLNIEQLKLVRNQLQLAEEAVEIASLRLEIEKKRFNAGKVDATNLNIAIQEELSARQGYYSSLWEVWRVHYQIRNLTLYDFINNRPIE